MQLIYYQFSFLRRHATRQMLIKLMQNIEEDPEDLLDYQQKIGEFLYEFQVNQIRWVGKKKQDTVKLWTVLKTLEQLQKFMNDHRLAVGGSIFDIKNKVNPNDFINSFDLSQIKYNYAEPPPRYIRKFFEIYNPQIQKITSLRMFRKVRGLTWAKKCQNFLCGVQWQMKRIYVSSEGIIQIQNDGTVTDFLKFDLYFSIQTGAAITSHQFGVALFSAHRKVVLRALNIKNFISFLFYTKTALQKYSIGINFAGSCRPSRTNNIQFIVDAQKYYHQISKQIERAKKTIFICGWWISPELYLRRPISQSNNSQYRLDRLLLRTAQRGIKIYIVVFFSPSVIPNDSQHTKRALSQHSNIIVQRHPHQFLPKLWSHHEKCVIIDQNIGFLGGLDLCYGRFDSPSHPISENNKEMYPGIDYNNVRIKDFMDVRNCDLDLQDRFKPRMPWHDVAYKVQGKFVADVANHFVQYWNFAILQKRLAPIVSKSNKQTINNLQQTRQNIQVEQKYQQSQRMILAILKLAIENNQVLSNKQKQQFADHLQNKSKGQKVKKKVRNWRLTNKFQLYNGAGENCMFLEIESLGLIRVGENKKKQILQDFQDQLQLLRSASQWSIGLEEGATERSIQNAYLYLIKNSQHFIYIENQFFISATGEEKSYVQNQIANALFERIKKAHQKAQKFKVVVIMPLLPGMQGELSQKCPLSLKLTMYWQYKTISRPGSLLARIRDELKVDPLEYIQFYSLRNHGVLGDNPVTELIYIHTKLMIIDDNYVLCGSANINDRSQAGDRDSQLAVIFTEGEKILKKIDGNYHQVNLKAHKLRCQLFMQHFDLKQYDVEDPLSGKLIKKMKEIALKNTQTFRTVFGCCPDDNVKKLSAVKQFEKIPERQLYEKLKDGIRGHAVQFPTEFLSEEKLYGFDLDMIQDIFT